MKKDTAIVIGYKNANSTGMIRALGQAGFDVVFASAYSPINSKYKTGYLHLPEKQEDQLKVLIDYIKKLPSKPALYTGDDGNGIFLDSNYELLSQHCYCPHAQGRLPEISDKAFMGRIAAEAGLNVPKTAVLDLNSAATCPLDYPVILKPHAGFAGRKIDIQICRDNAQFQSSVAFLQEAGYTKILVQQLLEDSTLQDICMMGFSLPDGTVKIPCIIRKIRSHPLKQGSLSYGIVENHIAGVCRDKLKAFVQKTGYIGIFDIDMMVCNDTAYFIEINYRNGQNGYVPTAAGYNIHANWFRGMQGKAVEDEHTLEQLYYMDEHNDYKHVFEGAISLRTWLAQRKQASVFSMYHKKDIKPFLSQYFRIPEKWKQKFLH